MGASNISSIASTPSASTGSTIDFLASKSPKNETAGSIAQLPSYSQTAGAPNLFS